RFHDVPHRMRLFGALQSLAIGVRCEIDYRYVKSLAEDARGFGSIEVSLNTDVHQDQVRGILFYLGNGFGAARNDAGYLIAPFPKNIGTLLGCDAPVFNDQYFLPPIDLHYYYLNDKTYVT